MRLLNILLLINLLPIVHPKTSKNHWKHHDNAAFRIAGGTEANIEDFPYMASVIYRTVRNHYREESLKCSAVIIDKFFALSADSCVTDLNLKLKDVINGTLIIRANSAFWSGATAASMDHRIANYHIISDVTDRRVSSRKDYVYYPNIGLFKVKDPFTGSNEKPIPLAPKDYMYTPRSTAIICGWGSTKENPAFPSSQLRNATVRITNYERCNATVNIVFDSTLQDNYMVCTFSHRQSICLYDTGGPLVQNGLLIAISSDADRLCDDLGYYPDIYTRISEYNDWIVKYMKLL